MQKPICQAFATVRRTIGEVLTITYNPLSIRPFITLACDESLLAVRYVIVELVFPIKTGSIKLSSFLCEDLAS